MADWHIDMGFDRDAEVNPGTSNYPLVWGAVAVSGPSSGSVSSMTFFNNNDTVEFFIYDISNLTDGSGQATTPAPTITSSWLSSVPADTNTPDGTKGFTAASLTAAQNAQVNALNTMSGSSIFANGQMQFPVWNIANPDGTPLSLTVNNPNVSSTNPSPNPASFGLTFSFTVGTKTYVVDPEMIVRP
jgi:hypothetical protein